MANMLQNVRKTIGFKKNMVYKIPPGGKVNHICPAAYVSLAKEAMMRKFIWQYLYSSTLSPYSLYNFMVKSACF